MNVWSRLHQRYHLLPHPSFCTFRFSPPPFISLHRRCPTPQINRTRSPQSKSLCVGARGRRRSPHNELMSAIFTVMPLSANRKWHKRELSWCYEVNQASNNYAHRSASHGQLFPWKQWSSRALFLLLFKSAHDWNL